ncbi:MAG: hypothetical protein V4541_04305 [Bacteroidota bacterium]
MQTEKQYKLEGCKVTVLFEPKLIKIAGSKRLLTFLKADIDRNSLHLVKLIKADYLKIMGKRLKITNNSLMVEIWGHLYASYFANALKNLIDLQIVENFATIITNRSDTIDCGESTIDPNRKFWDVLAKYKKLISLAL